MKTRKTLKRLTLNTETLRRLDEEALKKVDGAAPTVNGATCDCDPSVHTRCASCLCPI